MLNSTALRTIQARFPRPAGGPEWLGEFDPSDLSGGSGTIRRGWQSCGGAHRGHPARSLPHSLEVLVPPEVREIVGIQLIGVFALYSEAEREPAGTLGACISFGGEPRHIYELFSGRHYTDASDVLPPAKSFGDSICVESIGKTTIGGQSVRVDRMTIEFPYPLNPSSLIFRELGSPASFVIFDVTLLCSQPNGGCPFKGGNGKIALGEIAGIVRVGDRVRLGEALDQLADSLAHAADVDEARGQALTFLAMVTAATMEMGGRRSMHRVQLDAARELDRFTDRGRIADVTRKWVGVVAKDLYRDAGAASSRLVDQALQIVERNFARDITDATIAEQLGLSTSHFRHVFRSATGQPFHKYLVALRLEKAKTLLIEQNGAVQSVAQAVGFAGLNHFSRAFQQRFHTSPSSFRKGSDPANAESSRVLDQWGADGFHSSA